MAAYRVRGDDTARFYNARVGGDVQRGVVARAEFMQVILALHATAFVKSPASAWVTVTAAYRGERMVGERGRTCVKT